VFSGKARCNHGLKVKKICRGSLLVKKISTVHMLKRNATKNYYLGGLRFNDAFRKSPVIFRSDCAVLARVSTGKLPLKAILPLIEDFIHISSVLVKSLFQINVQCSTLNIQRSNER
jgi:hypothetical protein